MIEVNNIEVYGWEAAIRGMRNPMNSWAKSDSDYIKDDGFFAFKIGDNDLDLMRRLYKAGPEHRKYLRMIHVTTDVNAPLYWWKEFDTYKIATVSNSCSTMHKIAAKEFTENDFSHDHLDSEGLFALHMVINALNTNRELHLNAKVNGKKDLAKHYWWNMIQLLPSSYNQRRTVDRNYETVINMIGQRSGHKLDEWRTLVEQFKQLPYIAEITGEEDKTNE